MILDFGIGRNCLLFLSQRYKVISGFKLLIGFYRLKEGEDDIASLKRSS